MALCIYPVTSDFAAEIGDVDLSKPLSTPDLGAIKEAFWKYAVLVFPEQHLAPGDQLTFAKQFGPLEADEDRVLSGYARREAGLADISNVADQGKVWDEASDLRMFQAGNKLWHTDSSFKFTPALCSILYSHSVAPIGGHTEFADQRAAYDALPRAKQDSLRNLVAQHSIATSRERLGFSLNEATTTRKPPTPQMLVRTIPETDRRSLYVASHAGSIYGLEDSEGRKLIDELLAHATQRQFVYTHRWRPNDLVMWDNRCTMHRGTDYDDLRWKRDMQRATVSDVGNSCVQEGIPAPQ